MALVGKVLLHNLPYVRKGLDRDTHATHYPIGGTGFGYPVAQRRGGATETARNAGGLR